MRVLDLFSGIGGFSLGLGRAGMRTIAFCEIDPFCRKVLRKHWPDVKVFNDIRRLHAEELPEPIELVCGGYPCQPFSVAGKRLGEGDDRHLWQEIVRIIRELGASGSKPSWCLFENVAGHISMGLDSVLADLEGEGYACWPLVIPACAVNAPHRRDRVWVVAHSSRAGREKRNHAAEPGEQGYFTRRDLAEEIASDADCKRKPQQERFEQDVRGRFGDCCQWTTEPPICGTDDGVSNRVARLRALGNAVVPQIPEIIGRAILRAECIG